MLCESSMSKNPLYDGRPLLRLIELYVIDAVGELSPEDARTLDAMTPKLQEIYKSDGDWRASVAKAMLFPDTMPSLIRENWDKNQRIAKENGVSLGAQEFAQMFVDSNIPF